MGKLHIGPFVRTVNNEWARIREIANSSKCGAELDKIDAVYSLLGLIVAFSPKMERRQSWLARKAYYSVVGGKRPDLSFRNFWGFLVIAETSSPDWARQVPYYALYWPWGGERYTPAF